MALARQLGRAAAMGTGSELLGLIRSYWSLLLGNIVEWYEFAVYGYLAVYLEQHFFRGSKIGVWLGFGVTFLARPLGGVIIGVVGDRFGRSKAVNISIVGMLVGTVGQGLVPTYSSGNETLGHIGFVLLIILRFVQGLSAAAATAIWREPPHMMMQICLRDRTPIPEGPRGYSTRASCIVPSTYLSGRSWRLSGI